jgi:hypothetical protein
MIMSRSHIIEERRISVKNAFARTRDKALFILGLKNWAAYFRVIESEGGAMFISMGGWVMWYTWSGDI